VNQLAEIEALEILARCLDISSEACRDAKLRTTPEWDSFAHVEVVVEVEERTGIALTQEQVEQITSFDSLVRLLSELSAKT
jgi:acyl carrier protein